MINRIGTYCLSAAIALAAVSCDDDSSTNDIAIDYSSTQVKTFSLKADSKVLNNLDSVYFSIDLVNARIFNADSLPLGTKISRLLVDVTTDNCSAVELHFPREGKTDSIVDFLTNPNDSIDFSRGPVTLHLVSYDKIATRDYKIQVNVHKTIADSLVWDIKHPLSIPSTLSDPIAQRTVNFNKKYYTLTADAAGAVALNIANLPSLAGSDVTPSMSFKPVVDSFTATSSALYILSEDGSLYTSTDGSAWTSCNTTWKSITAPYGDTLTGIADINGTLYHVTYPADNETVVEANFPITGNSQVIRYTTEWSPRAQIITAGGLAADGTPTPTVWAYDGIDWACLNASTPLPAEGITMFPYYCCLTDTNTWVATTRSVIVAMGGRKAGQLINGDVYISYDLGFNWAKAPVSMQLPIQFPALYGSQAFVVSEEQHSRAVRPITEWDTPFIYLYGGCKPDGTLSPRIYRGVINRLQYKPLQ